MASTAVSSISRPPQARGNPEGQVPPSLAGVERFLLAADEIQHLRPRVAYLCRFHAFEAAHELDKTSSGRGVRQFKTALLERLEEENGPSLAARLRSTDLREIQSFYKEYYDSYVKALEDENADRAGLAQAYHTASVLFEVLCALDRKAKPEEKVAPEDLVSGQNLQEKAAEIIPFNILPLDAAGASLAIMQLPEIRVAVDALKQISGLPRPPGTRRANRQVLDWDILDWLESTFGFQKDNVRNQREHLILLLANAHARLRKPPPDPNGPLDGRAIKEVMNKVFKNYKQWCKFLGRKKNLTLPNAPEEVPQRQILYTALFLLIWGEAGNLRFMPECLAYIFHNMGWEVIGMLGGNVSLVTGQNVQPAYPGPGLGGSDKAFLLNVVTPIYEVVRKESENNGGGKAPHQDWRNYDDINEYFWKPKCFTAVSWPLKLDSNFFVSKEPVKGRGSAAKRVVPKGLQRERKANFVEYRSFWHLWRSWDRMWTFFILLLQALIIIAYSPKWHSFLTDMYEFKKLISVFITAAALRLLQGVLDVWFSLGLYRTMKGTTMLRLLSKLVVSLVWLILFVVLYVHMWDNPAGFAKNLKSLALQNFNSRDLYISLCAIYLLPNALALVLFSFPLIKRQLEMSNWRIIRFSLWWSQTSLYVGRGMHESTWSLLKYSLFWVALLTCKALFSYNLQIKPLVKPTRAISNNKNLYYEWAEICPGCNHNAGAILAIWAPVVIVYFLDTQIWYAIFSTIVGGTYGAFQRLGEIRTLGMLRSRFRSLPGAFNDNLIPAPVVAPRRFALARTFRKIDTKEQATKFAQLWNEVITSFREEDLISNREYDLMLVPYSAIELGSEVVQWPPFLLASKIYKAVQTAAEHNGSDAELWRKIKADEYMRCAVEECYASLKLLFDDLIEGSQEKWVIKALFEEAERTMMQGFVSTFRLEKLPKFHQKVVELTELLLKPDPANRSKVIRVLQDMFEVVTQDMLSDEARAALEISGALSKSKTSQLFATLQPKPAVAYPPQPSPAFEEQIKRFHLLLTIKDAAQDVPANLDARRRISFFTNSLFMNMPRAPQVKNMVSFSVMTPYYSEIVTYSKKELYEENEDGISTLFYLQKIYPDEWSNFLERIECKNEEEALAKDDGKEIRLWASYKGQTLARTVRGMMYYRRALQLQAFFDAATPQQIEEGYLSITQAADDLKKNQRSMWAHINAVADMKFTYVAACQIYGTQKRKNQKEAVDIFDLMKKNEAFRVAYIDEKEIEEHGKTRKEYYSVLVKADANGLEQEIYRIMLPGMVKLGEGKPENQNHAIVFTRGEALQTIDMNQDHYLEETFKMRNLLEEFHENHGIRPATILGVREHIFTGGVSSLAWFMSQQEMSFVTIGQRVLANPLKVRFHYGHPDVFDRLFHITRAGISKASRVINLSEDIFAGFNSTLRRGNVTHHEYIQVGKGRDVGLNQVSLFEAKVANGNGEQILSRDVYRLGHRLDFMRMMSAWFTTVGFFFNTMLVVLCLYAFLYGKFYLVMSGIQFSLEQQAKITSNASLLSAINTVSLVQIGLLMGLPMVMEMGLEQGFRQALLNFIMMQLQLASVFFTFSMGTKTHYFGRTVLHGGAKYRATGRGFVVRHEKFAENYRLYSRSHFVKALELLLLLIVWNAYGSFEGGSASYGLLTFSLYFLVCSWLFAPFLFNPSGFDWQKTVEDYDDWIKWLGHKGGIGVNANESWESWWAEEQEHLQYTGFWGKLWEVALSLRFFLFQYGVVYQMNVTHGNKAAWVYAVSWIVVVAFLILLKIVSFGRKRFSADFQLMFRLVKALAFIAAVVTLSLCLVFTRLTFRDLFSSILAFVPTGWGLLSIALVFKPTLKTLGLWDSVRAMARTYEYGMGIFIFAPVAVLAWLPFVSTIQTRLLFNTAFSRGLQISRILAGRKR